MNTISKEFMVDANEVGDLVVRKGSPSFWVMREQYDYQYYEQPFSVQGIAGGNVSITEGLVVVQIWVNKSLRDQLSLGDKFVVGQMLR